MRLEPAETCVVGFSVGADFVVSVGPEGATYRAADPAGANAIVRMTAPDFLRLVVRELSPDEAITSGRLKIEGDAPVVERFLAMLFGSVNGSPSP